MAIGRQGLALAVGPGTLGSSERDGRRSPKRPNCPQDAQVRRISWVSKGKAGRERFVASSSSLPAGHLLDNDERRIGARRDPAARAPRPNSRCVAYRGDKGPAMACTGLPRLISMAAAERSGSRSKRVRNQTARNLTYSDASSLAELGLRHQASGVTDDVTTA
jgi:hypothetical protein